LVEGIDAIERATTDVWRNPGRVVEIENGVACGTKRNSGVFAREVARLPGMAYR
jgi:hypothetical protein